MITQPAATGTADSRERGRSTSAARPDRRPGRDPRAGRADDGPAAQAVAAGRAGRPRAPPQPTPAPTPTPTHRAHSGPCSGARACSHPGGGACASAHPSPTAACDAARHTPAAVPSLASTSIKILIKSSSQKFVEALEQEANDHGGDCGGNSSATTATSNRNGNEHHGSPRTTTTPRPPTTSAGSSTSSTTSTTQRQFGRRERLEPPEVAAVGTMGSMPPAEDHPRARPGHRRARRVRHLAPPATEAAEVARTAGAQPRPPHRQTGARGAAQPPAKLARDRQRVARDAVLLDQMRRRVALGRARPPRPADVPQRRGT